MLNNKEVNKMFNHYNFINALTFSSFIFITGCGSDSTSKTFPIPTVGCGFDSNPNLNPIPTYSRVFASNTVLFDTCTNGAIWASDGSIENSYSVGNNQYNNLKQHNSSWYFTIYPEARLGNEYSIIKYSESGKNTIFSSKKFITDLTFVGNKLYFLLGTSQTHPLSNLYKELWVLEEGFNGPHKVELSQSKFIRDIISGGDHLIIQSVTIKDSKITNETIDRLNDNNIVNTVANLSKIHDSYFYKLLFSHNNQVMIEAGEYSDKYKKYFRVSKATTKCKTYDSVSKPLASFQGTLYFSKKINSRYELRAEKKQKNSALITFFDHDISLNSTNGSLFLTSANTHLSPENVVKTDIKLWKIDTLTRKKELISSLTNDKSSIIKSSFSEASSINEKIYYSISTLYNMSAWAIYTKLFQHKNLTPLASGEAIYASSAKSNTLPKITFINNSFYYSSAIVNDRDAFPTRSLYTIDNATGISKKLALCY